MFADKVNKTLFTRTISRDLISGLTTTIIIIILIPGIFYYFHSRAVANKELKSYAKRATAEFASGISLSMYNFELETMREISKAFLKSETLVGISVSVKGTNVFEKLPENIKGVFSRDTDIVWEGEKVASARLFFSNHKHEKELNSLFYLMISMLVCLVAAIATATHFILNSFLNTPLKALTRGIQSIAKGNYTSSLEEVVHKDINLIIREINQMSFKIIRRTRQLAQSEEKYRTLFENAVEGIYKTTAKGEFIEVNPVMSEILGYDSPEDLMLNVKNLGKDLYVNEEMREKFLFQMEKNGRINSFEVEMYCKDRKRIWVESSGRAVWNKDGDLVYIEGFMVDISQRKKMEMAIIAARDELEKRVKERTCELEEKTAKLERINRLFVDRELSMRELKSKIKELRAKLDEYGKNSY